MRIFLPLTLAAILFAGCETENHAGHQHMAMADAHAGAAHANMWANVHHAVAVIYPTRGNQVSGTLSFMQEGNAIHVTGDITGLAPNSTHAMHIHEFGDQSSVDGSSAGSHYNPEGHPHGNVTAPQHHAGDLGNIQADATGKVHIDMTVDDISIADVKNPIIGRGVVIHANPDDFSQPVGNAGGRIGVGVIGVAK